MISVCSSRSLNIYILCAIHNNCHFGFFLLFHRKDVLSLAVGLFLEHIVDNFEKKINNKK